MGKIPVNQSESSFELPMNSRTLGGRPLAREIQFSDHGVILKLSGWTAFFALKFKINMPYSTIKHVVVDYFDAPAWMLRMPGTSIAALNIFEGSFWYKNEWYFLSYERKVPLLMIELSGHEKYRYVIVEIDEPASVAAELHRHLERP